MLLEVRELSKSYALGKTQLPALTAINAQFQAGEFTALVGKSGSGKSTLLHCLGLIDAIDGGDILVKDIRVSALKDADKAAFRLKTFGFIFQSYCLIPTLSVIENVALPALYQSKKKAQSFDRARTLLTQVGLDDFIDRNIDHLSGGQRQRVAIARSLVNGPNIILADEPTANLDSANASGVMELLKKLCKERGVTVILSSHDPQITQHADRIIQMKDGRII